MSFLRYLYAHLLPLSVFVVAGGTVVLFLYATGTDGEDIAVAGGIGFLFAAAGLVSDWLLKRRREKRLRATIGGIERKELLGEVLAAPPDTEERIYYDALKAVSRASLTRIAEAEREKADYREFVEQWIHEFKTPLAAMSLIIDNGCDTGKLRRELERADNLTEEVLYYARSVSPDRDLVIRETDLPAVAAAAVAGLKNNLIAAKLRVAITGAGTAYSDGKWLGFIVKQLVLNSSQYTPAGGRISIEVCPESICVRDDGIGILPEELPRVTQRGFTGTNGRAREKSTGMGLYIVRVLCEHLGIGLRIDSAPGEGTAVFLLLSETLRKRKENEI